MVKKFKLHSIGNYEKFNYYIFDKKKEIVEEVSNLLGKVFGIYLNFEDCFFIKSRKINYEKKKDLHFMDSNDKTRADIYFGDKKMFVTINCSNKLRLKFNDELLLIAYVPKSKKGENYEKIFR